MIRGLGRYNGSLGKTVNTRKKYCWPGNVTGLYGTKNRPCHASKIRRSTIKPWL